MSLQRKVLLYECFSGIAGDMHLGAMLDLGVPEDFVREQLSKLGLESEFAITTERAKKSGITGTKVHVACKESHIHRRLADIRRIYAASSLDDQVQSRALQIFNSLAEAEAKVHGVTPEEIHFHEVGAVDAIVDITSAAICHEYLNPAKVIGSTVELGSGWVRCAHGRMPVPAPATALLLTDVPTTRDNITGEATTPTGAAILKTLVDEWQAKKTLKVERIGYGVGHKDFEVPNVVRVNLCEHDQVLDEEENQIVESNIDDMTPEAFEPLIDELFAAGARDVYLTPIQMKRFRPATQLSVIVGEEQKQSVIQCLLAHSTTIGVRSYSVQKHVLPRSITTVKTTLGEVRVKQSELPNESRRWKSEYSDVARLAKEHKTPFLAAKARIDREIESYLDN